MFTKLKTYSCVGKYLWSQLKKYTVNIKLIMNHL